MFYTNRINIRQIKTFDSVRMKSFMNIFNYPFKSLFSLAALSAVLVPMYFVGIIVNGYSINESLVSAHQWHSNEMIFAFTSALLFGFLLTAAPKWAQAKAVSKEWAISIVLLWVAGRVVFILQPNTWSLYLLPVLPTLLVIYKLNSLLKRNKNRFVVIILLLFFQLGHTLFLNGTFSNNDLKVEASYKFLAFVISTFLIIFSGKLIPFFVNSKFKENLLEQKPKFDLSIVGLSFLTHLFSILQYKNLTILFSLICFILLTVRIFKFSYKKVLQFPLLWILYIGHIWLNLYFLLKSAILINENLDEGRALLHILFAGALGVIALGMMTRVSLGHSGLEIKADKLVKLSFYSILIGSTIRVLHPILLKGLHPTLLHISMGFWTLAFILYLIKFIPIFIKK